MKKYVIEVTEGVAKAAGLKAKSDVVHFLEEVNYQKIAYQVPKEKIARAILGKKIWRKNLSDVEENSVIIYQYPAYSRILGDYFVEEARKIKGIKLVLMIHDVDSLRAYRDSEKDSKREIKFFNQFDGIIAHNEKMIDWLKKNNVMVPIVSLEVFDYYETTSYVEPNLTKPIVFAGNLGKSTFLENLDLEKEIFLYGLNPADKYPSHITYHGAFASEELGKHLKGSFGLVWDGNSTDTCSGMTGDYMKYNNPHKVSLYLSLGLPIIIWSKAALSDFILKNNLGIVVDNLSEIDKVLATMSSEEYDLMKKSVYEVFKKVRTGFYIKAAVDKVCM